jgi:hypothetical protein
MLGGGGATEVSELERAKGDLYMSFYPVPMINCSKKYVNFKKMNERRKTMQERQVVSLKKLKRTGDFMNNMVRIVTV